MSADQIAYHEQLSICSRRSQSIYQTKLEWLKSLPVWLMIVLHLQTDEGWYYP